MSQTEAVGVDPGQGRCEHHVLVRKADGGNGVCDPFCEVSSAKGIRTHFFFFFFFLFWRNGLTRFSLTIICLARCWLRNFDDPDLTITTEDSQQPDF